MNNLEKDTEKFSMYIGSPYENILGTAERFNLKEGLRNVENLQGKRFGKYIGGGKEQIVFQDASNPNQVLKIQTDIPVKSPLDARKEPSLMNIRLKNRNKVPYQLHSKLEGFVKIGDRYYPVHKLKKIRPMPKMSSTIFESAIKSRITYALKEKGFTLKDGRYIRGNTIIEDIKPDNIGIDEENDSIRFFDVLSFEN